MDWTATGEEGGESRGQDRACCACGEGGKAQGSWRWSCGEVWEEVYMFNGLRGTGCNSV
jgi:hypothetical protein